MCVICVEKLTLYHIPSDDDDDDDDEHFMIQHLLACFDSKSVIWEPWLHLQSFTLLREGTHLKTRSPSGCLAGLRLRICDQT